MVKISPEGKIIREIILVGKSPTNIAFGGTDGCTAYVTLQDQGNLESFRTDLPRTGMGNAKKSKNQITNLLLINMKKTRLLLLIISLMITGLLKAQTYNIVIKGGHVIDPKNNIDEVMDIAVKDGKIALIAKNIEEKDGIQVVNARGLYVTPGLIDIHVHVFNGI